MRGPGSKPDLLFRLVVPATAVFVITILSLIAVLFGDQRSPVAQFLDRHGNRLLLVEFIVVIVLTVLAMAVDRQRILRDQRKTGEADKRPADVELPPPQPGSDAESDG